MKRETITLMLNCVEDGFISETAVFRPASRQESPERTAHMKRNGSLLLHLLQHCCLPLESRPMLCGAFTLPGSRS